MAGHGRKNKDEQLLEFPLCHGAGSRIFGRG